MPTAYNRVHFQDILSDFGHLPLHHLLDLIESAIFAGESITPSSVDCSGGGTFAGELEPEASFKFGGVKCPKNVTFAAAAGGTNVAEVTLTVKDGAGATLARVVPLLIWLSDAATGLGLTGTTASGTVTAKAASGTDLVALTAKKCLVGFTKSDGTFILEITDNAKTTFYVAAVPLTAPGAGISVSAQLTAGNYG